MDKEFSEKNKKRRLKTSSQVVALEKFYEERKYPSEFEKSEIAEEIGLTQKQVSGWFCHRRLKDKRSLRDDRYANIRQDHSSVVIQDRGSGLVQDSCGSTKHGDSFIDPREVESRRPYLNEFSSRDDGRCRKLYDDDNSDTEHTSSESCSSLQDRLISHQNPLEMETSRSLTLEGVSPSVPKISKGFPYKPSGYLKVKGEIENAAITAVKRQLGMQYKKDGPPLGVEFQPLPPGAFESSVNYESYYVGTPDIPHSSDISALKKQNKFGPRFERHNSIKSRDMYIEEAIPTDTFCRSESRNKNSCHHPVTGQNASIYKESPSRTFPYKKKNSLTSSSYDGENMLSNSVFNRHGGYDSAIAGKQRDYDIVGSEGLPRPEYSKNRQSKLMQSSRKPYYSKEKRVKFDQGVGALEEYSDPLIMQRCPRNELTVAKQSRVELMRQDYSSNSPTSDHIYPVKRCGVGMPSGGTSEEDSAETTSLSSG